MNGLNLYQILSPKHIQDTGRDLWQKYHDNDALEELNEGVEDKIAQEVSAIIYPNKEVVESLDDLQIEAQEIIATLIGECLDVAELNQEAADNTEYLHEVAEARKGQY